MDRRILITGDYIIDHHILKGNKKQTTGSGENGTVVRKTYGGARLTFELAEKIFGTIAEMEKAKAVATMKESANYNLIWSFDKMVGMEETEGTIRDSYLQWNLDCKKNKTYKLSEKLGFGSLDAAPVDRWLSVSLPSREAKCDLVLIDEAALGFRAKRQSWPNFKSADQIIFKTTSPLCKSDLWNELLKHKQKLITVVGINQLRHYNIRVSNNISWERTALDLVHGINEHPILHQLMQCSYLIITIGSAGALVIKDGKEEKKAEFTLVFDPECMENEWEEKHRSEMISDTGLGSAFVSGFTGWYQYKGGIIDGVKVGLNCINAALIKGIYDFGNTGIVPVRDLSDALKETFFKRRYISAFVPSPYWEPAISYLNNDAWTILENNYNHKKPEKQGKVDLKHPLLDLSYSLAVRGSSDLRCAPFLKFGKVITYDRSEIENLRNIKRQIAFYLDHGDGSQPLNIAVFGPPGAGKSFVVKEMARELAVTGTVKPVFLTYNLSQFRDETQLPGAFHAIRDAVLEGKLPYVFWDEFDADEYFWLKRMIAPMQDGRFSEGQEIHPIGKAIFIYAGGASYTMDHFAEKMNTTDLQNKKGPDFLSRINCYLNVYGPNRRPFKPGNRSEWRKEGDPKDICFPVRRALFIRSILQKDDSQLQIDPPLLLALLGTINYIHGSRSLARLLEHLAAKKNTTIERSDLPSDSILRMNVTFDNFMELLYAKGWEEDMMMEKIARQIHEVWLDSKVSHSVYYKQYEELSYDGRIDNLQASKRMRQVIQKSGKFKLVSESDQQLCGLPEASEAFLQYIKDDKNLDVLAEEEHKGWMKVRTETGWKKGERSDYHKTHPCLVPFNELDKGITNRKDQKEKNKDRDTIRKYGEMLKQSGFVIVR